MLQRKKITSIAITLTVIYQNVNFNILKTKRPITENCFSHLFGHIRLYYLTCDELNKHHGRMDD